MRALETGLFAAMLVLVPACGWLLGRVLGRRDFKIGAVIVAGGVAAALPHMLRWIIMSAVDGRAFAAALAGVWQRASERPEIGLFFVALGVFMTMLGWTATPVMQVPDSAQPSDKQ